MAEIKEDILALISKIWVWCLYIVIGLLGQFSYNFMMGKKITLVQAFASAGIALFVGFVVSVICVQQDMEKQGMWIVPCATLISDKLVMAFIAFDWKSTLGDWIRYWADKFKP